MISSNFQNSKIQTVSLYRHSNNNWRTRECPFTSQSELDTARLGGVVSLVQCVLDAKIDAAIRASSLHRIPFFAEASTTKPGPSSDPHRFEQRSISSLHY